MAFPDYTYDRYCDFEAGLPAAWTETDAGGNLNVQSATAKYYGSYGMAYDGVNSPFIRTDFGVNPTSISLGFWMYTGVHTDWARNYVVYTDNSTLGAVPIRALWGDTEGGDAKFTLRNDTGTYSAAGVTVADATWYWVTIQATISGTAYLRVYNTSHAQVGAEISVAVNANNNFRYLNIIGPASSSAVVYYDDIVIDWTDATYPLLGWETAAGGTNVSKYKKYYDYRRSQ